MAGQIKHLIDRMVELRAKGNPVLIQTTKAKLIFKGLNPERYTAASPDDPAIIDKVHAMAAELGIRL